MRLIPQPVGAKKSPVGVNPTGLRRMCVTTHAGQAWSISRSIARVRNSAGFSASRAWTSLLTSALWRSSAARLQCFRATRFDRRGGGAARCHIDLAALLWQTGIGQLRRFPTGTAPMFRISQNGQEPIVDVDSIE